jgi:hypothetical protein
VRGLHITASAPGYAAIESRLLGGVTELAAAFAKAAAAVGGGGPSGVARRPPTNLQGAASALMPADARYGWGSGPERNGLNYAKPRYSIARNSIAGAYGVAHFIQGSSEYYAYGGNPSTAWGQSVAMLNYVWQWYGDAIAAATYERCVPLDAVILTKTDWKSYDQLVPGEDETIGWNPETGQSEWTRVLGISYYDDAPLVRLSNKSWSAECTPAHRWATRHWTRDCCAGPYRTEDVMTATDRLTSRHSIRLAAQASTGTGPAISEQEAELLGWVLGDGSVAYIKAKPGSDPAHWRTGTGSRVSIRLYPGLLT